MRENKSSPEFVYKAFAEYYDAYVAGFEADFEIYHQFEPLETTDRGFLVTGRRETGGGEG
ncbi:MAG: hypothetical protein PHV56_08210 [Clostridia bacterium]|nr:hypothetical protein [Clostridia bacterium]